MRVALAAALLAAPLAVATVTAPPTVAAATCQGETATKVGVAGRLVSGTDGADVIVSNGAFQVDARGGDDLVCVTRSAALVSDGEGDDSVVVQATPRLAEETLDVELGPGEDRYQGWTGVDRVTDADTDADVILTGAGRDEVTVGVAGTPMADRVSLGHEPARVRLPVHYDDVMGGEQSYGFVRVRSESMAPGAAIGVVSGPAELDLTWAGAGTWDLDNAAGTASESGTERFRFAGFTAFDAPEGDVTFTGTAADEYVRVGRFGGGVLHAAMWGGDDVAVVTRGSAEAVTGGTGVDHLVALAYADQFEREDDPDAGIVRLTLASQTGRLHDVAFSYRGFERYVVHGTGRAYVTGSAGPDVVSGSSCFIGFAGGDGADTLRGWASDWSRYDPDWHCSVSGAKVGMEGGAGDDVLVSEVPDRFNVQGGPGDDRISGPHTTHVDAFGQLGDDTIHGSDAYDTLSGGPGDDYLDGEGGNDHLNGGDGNDRLYGDSGRDEAVASRGNDLCRAEVRRGCER